MAHIFASMFFTLIALASAAVVAFSLLEAREKIMLALGMATKPACSATGNRIRVRAAGRWQPSVRPVSVSARKSAAA